MKYLFCQNALNNYFRIAELTIKYKNARARALDSLTMFCIDTIFVSNEECDCYFSLEVKYTILLRRWAFICICSDNIIKNCQKRSAKTTNGRSFLDKTLISR